MTGREAWGIVGPIIRQLMETAIQEENDAAVAAYATIFVALGNYDKHKVEKAAEEEILEDEADEALKAGIGDRIKAVMQEKGITQHDLAKRCKLTETSVSRYISNTRFYIGG